MWIEAKDKDGNIVKVKQCAKGSDMFVSDKEDYYNVRDLEIVGESVNTSDPMVGLMNMVKTMDPIAQQRAIQRDKLSLFWTEQRVEIMKILLQRRFMDTPTDTLDLTDMIINRLYEQNDKFQDRLNADLRK